MVSGVYGDVVRVKILYNKRDSALIQFKEPQQIHTGIYILYVWSGVEHELFASSKRHSGHSYGC